MTKNERYNLIKRVVRKIELQNKSKHAMSQAQGNGHRKASLGKAVEYDEEAINGYGFIPATREDEKQAAYLSGALDNYNSSIKEWDL